MGAAGHVDARDSFVACAPGGYQSKGEGFQQTGLRSRVGLESLTSVLGGKYAN